MKLPRLSLLSQICITHLISHIHMLVLPVLMPVMLLTRQDVDFIQIGFAISVFNIVSAVVQAPVGFFVDRIGPKRVLLTGLIIGSLSFLSIGLIEHYIWLIIAMGIAGAANAVYHPADYAILSQNVTEKRMGRAFSLHTFSGYIGFAVTPTLMLTVSAFYNVGMAFIVSGVIGLIAVVILYPKARNEGRKKTEESQSIEHKESTNKVSTKLPLMTPAIFFMLILFLLLSLSGGSIQNFSVSALVTGYHISLADANVALTAFLVASAVGVLVGGQLADYSSRHGFIATAALAVTALLAVLVALLSVSSTLIITLIIGVMGFLSGLIAPSRDMLVRNISPKGAEGRVFGIVSTGFNIGGTIGPVLFGWILDQNSPRGIFWCTAIFMALTAMIAFYQEIKGTKRQ
ncbi:sugar phosphate permease [Orbus hercynius]|uniref:Sugar phosphate permease n=1 Tax=Orbus hercynius TaxID=593135 RepID=A0A495RHG2_9GAMM|nr:MFS transporter [Orbus hercynius]RKS86967.1 sugar phosphate permease [Orbus hercynius]